MKPRALAFAPAGMLAVAGCSGAPGEIGSALGETLGVLVALAAVLLLAWFSLRVWRRVQAGAPTRSEIAFVRTLPVGPRERLVVINYHGETLLLGVTAGQVAVLSRHPAEPDVAAADVTALRTAVAEGGGSSNDLVRLFRAARRRLRLRLRGRVGETPS